MMLTAAYAERRNGELTNTRPQGVQAVADRGPIGACACRGSITAPRPASVRHTTFDAAPTPDADRRQADYFLRLLIQDCLRIERQIDRYQKAIAIAEADGAADHGRRLRRVMRIEGQERQKLKGMIDRLQRRFPRTSLG